MFDRRRSGSLPEAPLRRRRSTFVPRHMVGLAVDRGVEGTEPCRGAIKDWGHGRGDLHDGRLSRRSARNSSSRRRGGPVTAPTRYLSGGRRKPRGLAPQWASGVLEMKKVFTTGQVAKICKVAPRTVSKWFDSGRLRGYRIPGSQDRRIPREHLAVPQGAWNALGRPRSRGLS